MVVCCIGEVLWDVFPDQELLGGAPLNVSVNLHRLGVEVVLVSGVGSDERGVRALEAIKAIGLDVSRIAISNQQTGIAEVVRSAAMGDQHFVIPRPAAFDSFVSESPRKVEEPTEAMDWIYMGTLHQTNPEAERFTRKLIGDAPSARVFYDVNMRDGHWDLALIQRLSGLSTVVKVNEAEAERLFEMTYPGSTFGLRTFCELWATTHDVNVMCVTLGDRGAFVFSQGVAEKVPGLKVELHDTVGAGDAFSAAFLYAYHHAWPLGEAACFGNALGALVASRPGAVPSWTMDEILPLLPSESTIPSLLTANDLLADVRSS